MSLQYIVAAFLDGTMVVDASGPYRSRAKAEAVCDQLNEAAEWSEAGPETTTLIAQVVLLRPAAELMEEMSDPERISA